MTTNVMDFINGGAKVASAKFGTIGDAIVGTVLDTDIQQCRDFATNDPVFWDKEKTEPKMQLVVTLQTDERDGDDDDGRRRIFAPKPSNMLTAIADALGGKELEAGGKLAVAFTGEKPHENPRFNAIKEYAAAYEAPKTVGAAALLNGATSDPAPTTAGEPATAAPATNVADLL